VSNRTVALCLAALLWAGCVGGAPETLSGEQFDELIASLEAPTLVLFWADWSRPAVELLPTAAELAAEYEGAGLQVVTVRLGAADPQDAPPGFPAGSRHVSLTEDPSFALARYGLTDVPAALVFARGGELLFALDSTDAAPLTPAELADAIEGALE
jgi:thiol-disulfide isomerase/thioredoxin